MFTKLEFDHRILIHLLTIEVLDKFKNKKNINQQLTKAGFYLLEGIIYLKFFFLFLDMVFPFSYAFFENLICIFQVIMNFILILLNS